MRHLLSLGLLVFGFNTLFAEEVANSDSHQNMIEYIQELTGKIDELTRTVEELQKRITLLEVNSCSQHNEAPQKAAPATPSAPKTPAQPATPDKPSASADVLWSNGNADLQRKDFPAAEKAFSEIVRFYPNHAHATEASYWVGEILLMSKRYEDAQKYYALSYKAFADSDSRKAEVGLKIAECYFALNKNKEGCLFLKEIMKLKQNGANISSATLQLMQKYWAQHKCAG
jgi:TolA-binding protein